MRNRKRQRRWVLALFLLLIGTSMALWTNWVLSGPYLPKSAYVRIKKGYSASKVADLLYSQNVIRSKPAFLLWMRLSGGANHIKTGTFIFVGKVPLRTTIRQLQKVPPPLMIKVTIPEGYNMAEIARAIDKAGIVPSADFLTYVQTRAKTELAPSIGFLAKIPTDNLEGYLFPDTYIFAEGAPAREITQTMLATFAQKALPLIASHNKSMRLHEVVTLAAIIEREARVPTEMPLISGVFHTRLQKKMPLGADPTVGYAIGNPRKMPITFEDIKADSPYNTYRIVGLPPSPIASPGATAIMAALKPEKTSYLYFVADNTGRHIFARTLAEHLAAQAKVQAARN